MTRSFYSNMTKGIANTECKPVLKARHPYPGDNHLIQVEIIMKSRKRPPKLVKKSTTDVPGCGSTTRSL
ncbi:hypothetical protein BPAE_0002g00990 [Botrytis paeoniae]|uniref:Uncharacterized protein n=1 Tax=Botrytis paeoniae TaxID=278948 RepID=A0A4Z1G1V1_9HELO|nr:hypothetical protein BPAE_0002g00990 [Botrytis paeoniae]